MAQDGGSGWCVLPALWRALAASGDSGCSDGSSLLLAAAASLDAATSFAGGSSTAAAGMAALGAGRSGGFSVRGISSSLDADVTAASQLLPSVRSCQRGNAPSNSRQGRHEPSHVCWVGGLAVDWWKLEVAALFVISYSRHLLTLTHLLQAAPQQASLP